MDQRFQELFSEDNAFSSALANAKEIAESAANPDIQRGQILLGASGLIFSGLQATKTVKSIIGSKAAAAQDEADNAIDSLLENVPGIKYTSVRDIVNSRRPQFRSPEEASGEEEPAGQEMRNVVEGEDAAKLGEDLGEQNEPVPEISETNIDSPFTEVVGETVGETAAETVGEGVGELAGIGTAEAVGAGLDATGVLAPIGAIIGAGAAIAGVVETILGNQHKAIPKMVTQAVADLGSQSINTIGENF